LTIGIQTRIDSRAQALARAAHVGNVYINSNQIGAVVGVQPALPVPLLRGADDYREHHGGRGECGAVGGVT
jgi:acyl-CoA reductase-like NAD-dependent aldehyde dehydrogenase